MTEQEAIDFAALQAQLAEKEAALNEALTIATRSALKFGESADKIRLLKSQLATSERELKHSNDYGDSMEIANEGLRDTSQQRDRLQAELQAARAALFKEAIEKDDIIAVLNERIHTLEQGEQEPWDFPDASPSYAQLEARVGALQAENAELKQKVHYREQLLASHETEIVNLQTALDEAKGLMRQLEWISGDSESECPACLNRQHEGHGDSCIIAAFLAAQGGVK